MIYKMLPAAAILGLAATVSAQPATAEKPKELSNTVSTADPAEMKSDSSYGIGFNMGSQLSGGGLTKDDIASERFIAGLNDALSGKQPGLSEEKLRATMQALQQTVMMREKKVSEDNLKAGEKFLEENAKRKGVVTTESGLQYEIINKGGDKKYEEPKAEKEGEPAPQKVFMVNYKGTTIDGAEFDASPEGQPREMSLQVIPGFKEALTTMPVGAKWKLFIPANLAYGPQRRGAKILPNSALIFDLELVEIKDAPAQSPMQFATPPAGQPRPKPATAATPPVSVPPAPAPKGK